MSRRKRRRAQTKSAKLGRPPPFLLAFLGVLMVGGLALMTGLWWSGREPGPSPALPRVADGGTSGRRVSAEIGAFFTEEGDPGLGSPQAPVTVEEFSDYQCPNCRQFATDVVPYLKETWLPRGLVKIVYKDFAIRGPDSERAAAAAHCAGDQGRYWSYHDVLFELFGREGLYEPSSLIALAGQIGLDAERFARCLSEGRHADRVAASTEEGHARGFEGTPTYLIDGRQTEGSIPIADWEALFQAYAQDYGSGSP